MENRQGRDKIPAIYRLIEPMAVVLLFRVPKKADVGNLVPVDCCAAFDWYR